jgi:hypothetical protein
MLKTSTYAKLRAPFFVRLHGATHIGRAIESPSADWNVADVRLMPDWAWVELS